MLRSKRKASNAELAEKKENIPHQSGLDSWSCEDKVYSLIGCDDGTGDDDDDDEDDHDDDA